MNNNLLVCILILVIIVLLICYIRKRERFIPASAIIQIIQSKYRDDSHKFDGI
jgi:hypothetical protein